MRRVLPQRADASAAEEKRAQCSTARIAWRTSSSLTDRQIGHLQSTPARLLLCNRQAPGGADDLAHTRMTEQVRVHRCRLAIRESPFLGPEQKSAGQIHLTSREENLFGTTTVILQVGQDEAVAPHVHDAEGQSFAHARAGCPEHTQQQAVALGGRRVDDSQDVLRGSAFGRLPLLGRTRSDRTSF
jgi:hypothetical protein